MSVRRRRTIETPGPLQSQASTTTNAGGGPAARSRDATIPLPTYETPLAPLTAKAQQEMQNLLERKYPLRKMEEHVKRAAGALEESTGDINDQLMEKHITIKKRKARRAKDGVSDMELDDKENEDLATMKKKVEAMTERMDIAIRKCIDGEASLTNLEKTMKELSRTTTNAFDAQQAHEQAQSQALTQSQRGTRPRIGDDEDEDEDDHDDTREPSVTQPGGTSRTTQQPSSALPSLTPLFSTTLNAHADVYTSQSLRTRYSEHPSYVSFKKITHDAQHPDQEAPPLPHPSTWFVKEERAGSPLPGMTQQGGRSTTRVPATQEPGEGEDATEDHSGDNDDNAAEDANDDDDDIAVARIKISTRCPLTLREFTEPVTSRVCSHSFERSAIHSMIDAQRPPTRGARAMRDAWHPKVQCPVAGCNATLGKDDLVVDKVLIRRIQRIQRARELRQSRGFGDGDDAQHADDTTMLDDEGAEQLVDSEASEAGASAEEQSGDDIDEIEDD